MRFPVQLRPLLSPARRRWAPGLLLLGAALWPGPAGAAADAPEPITDPAQIWTLSTEAKAAAHPLRIEGRVSYYDPVWGLFWLERNGAGTYVQLSAHPPALRTGQYVILTGSIVPTKGLAADTTAVTVVQEDAPASPLAGNGRIRDMDALGGRVVTVDAYVDGQQLIDDAHVRLNLIVDDRPAIGWVTPDDPRSIPRWQGCLVRATALYSGRFDPTGTQTSIELWIGRQRDLAVTGSIATLPDFDLPRTPINALYRAPAGQRVHIRGRVQAQETGRSISVRDDTGQVVIRSLQKQRVPLGAEVEVVGRVTIDGAQWILQPALYREAPPPAASAAASPVLESADQIRQLTPAEAAAGRLVSLQGMVTWALPGYDFFFLQDLTGGVRVHFTAQQMETPKLQQSLALEGVTVDDAAGPAIAVRHYRDIGSMMAPPPRPITYDQAITGRENGQWVEMRGFLQRIVSQGDLRRVHIITPAGEFYAELLSPVNLAANPGSLINVHGVCETMLDRNGRITGVQLRVPFLHSFTVEEDAPANLFDLPLRTVRDLRALSATRELRRVRVAGTVLAARPGQSVHLEEDGAGLLVLSREAPPLEPGDVVEAVGILGRDGLRTVLREAAFQKTGTRPAPAPLAVSQPGRASMALDERLVRIPGLLVDTLRQPNRLRLTLECASTFYEATLNLPAGQAPPAGLQAGADLELTGLYHAAFDDARQLRGFELELRSAGDIAVVQPARFWTAERALTAAAILAGCALLGLGWIVALRRRVHRQTAQIRAQLEQQARLEAEVQRAARLESLGVLAGGIAHDFNNVLTVVMGNVSLAQLDGQAAASAGPFLREIERAAHRARDLTQQLLTFAKGGQPLRVPLDLAAVVREAAASVATSPDLRIDYAFAAGLWPATADKDQVVQAVRNILRNAAEAMPRGGPVRIALANDELAGGTAPPLPAGRYVRLAVTDAGVGIKPEVLPQIFDPYFSTKRTGRGMGLATVYSIVKRHLGHIAVESVPDRGTTVTLWLPAAETPAPARVTPALPTALPQPAPAARVLLMDDEESIRRVGAQLLERMGLVVSVASDGGDALRQFTAARDRAQPFDLLILDLTVPGGMGGKQTIAAIRELDPRVPAIVSSGYSDDPVMAEFRAHGFQGVVPKPYDASTLAEIVGRLLARRT
ncbi:MAG TPA: ATP-binding protein [Opitutaceae bacterium]|nr:ATP-binding protein [Opitutaceae bacterium]